ncbi:D-alanyl-D-alanine carboxypeptidase family protein [Roseomonas genomospecies 6]|uniref:D-alanyl-D-alanine carboxypeptidase n=1 Tax=Roseomonas genomospecies 6 TaxID=214106 RepID=A0A9W7U161_9PROT|nr:D-alanyl-D-alanine carboxypeptidase family protein [Roseomonas genomospecies 6]KAA0684240.1 D-alanyl-D-alanine carboxypeptidase [Roseomonas genomospecies 6]
MPRSPYGFVLPLLLSLAVATPVAVNPADAFAKAAQETARKDAPKPAAKVVAKTVAKPAPKAAPKVAAKPAAVHKPVVRKAAAHRTAKARGRAGRIAAGAAVGTAAGATVFRPVHAYVLMDAQSGRVLDSENADTPTYPASLTKMMTLLLTFEALERGTLRLDQELPVSRHATNQKPSRLNLAVGSTIRVEDAILALTVKSANDVAVVLAEALGGSEERFAEMMTDKAQALGMTSTTFRNASGLPHKEQRTTARDMARLSRAIVARPAREYAYFSRTRFDWNGTVVPGHNRLLGRVEGYDGIKTGFINLSGFNLAGSASRNGQRLVAVVLGGTTAAARDREVAELLERGFGTGPAKQTVAVTDVKAVR